MSARFPIKRKKQSRSSSDDINNSFVKNVTARMSGLMPASMSKWFGSPSSSNANGSAPVAESSDSSTEDETLEDQITQPLSKKMRFSSPSTLNEYVPKTKSTGTNTESTETFSIVKARINMSAFRPEANFVSTPIHSPNDETEPEQNTECNLQNSYSSLGYNSIISKRKSLFDMPDEERPDSSRIKIATSSLMSSPCSVPMIKRSLLGSPFYAGKTRYGGAASSCMPNIKHRKMALVSKSENNDSITISHATRRVMDLLENYPSPLIEAKRILQCARTSTSEDKTLTNNAYKTQELHVPSMAKILRIKQKSRLMDSTSAARQIIASNSSSVAFTPYPVSKTPSNSPVENPDKLNIKMKVNITRINRNYNSATEESASVHLPTAVLQIDPNSLPKFTLGSGATTETLSDSTKISAVETSANASDSESGTTTTATSSTIVNTKPISATNIIKQDAPINNKTEIASKPNTTIDGNPYKFSSPVMIHEGTVQNLSSPLPNYTFGSPEGRPTEQSKETESNKKISTETWTETWKCDDCWVSNNSNSDKCVCCGAGKPTKSPAKVKHCSVCKVVLSQECLDKCNDCEAKIDKVDGLLINSITTSKWKCLDCWVINYESADKCVCCGGKKPQEVVPVPKSSKSDNIASEWKCDICWIKNKSSDGKCVACGAAKPDSTQSQTKEYISQPQTGIQARSDSTFKNIMNSQCEKWECTNCLVRNDKDRSKCVCCDTEKPGITKESEKKSFNFGTIQNTTFKFGIDRNQNISETKTDSTPVMQIEMSAKQSESNNNYVTSTFTFGIPKPKPSNKIITEKETIAEETPKQTFTFGVSKSLVSSAPAATTSHFSSPIDTGSKFPESAPPSSSIETDEKVQEVPNIEQPNTTAPNNEQKPVGLFGISLNTSSVATTAPAAISFGKTEQAIPAITTSLDTKVPKSTFSFSSAGNSGLQLFSTAVTTAASSSISFPAVQAPSTMSISFFQKSEPVNTSSMQLFSKTDPAPSSLSLFNNNEGTVTTSTTVGASSLSSAPVFSFGSNTQNTQVEKPKFNFTFGTTSEIPAVFGLPKTNAGNILTGNGLPSDNNTGNTVSGGIGLATVISTPAGNSLSSTSIASGLMGEPAKNDNIMWPSNNEVSAIKMASGNSIEQGNNNLPAIQSSNLFSLQAKKENTWLMNQNTSLGLPKLPSGNTDPINNSGGAASSMFGVPEKKENMWSMSNNNTNMFAHNVVTNSASKPATFSFGSSMQFNSNNVTPAPTFGNPTQPQAQNIFGMSSQLNNNQPTMFSSTLQNQTPPNIFGAQAVNNTVPSVGMFGTPNAAATPTFGTSNSTLPTFEAIPLNPVTPSFNFGAQQTAVFGFGQQQAQSPGGVYKFGATAGGSPQPQRQFNIGTAGGAANAMSRRPIRRAVRRTNQR